MVNAVQHESLKITACWDMIPVDTASYPRIIFVNNDYIKMNEEDEACSTQRGDKYEITF